VDVFDHSVESILIAVMLYEEEFESFFLEHLPSWGELEEYSIEAELESIFPLFYFLVFCSLTVEYIESSTCLVVRDDECIIWEPLDTIDLPGELDIPEPCPTSCGTEVLLESELSVGLTYDLTIERLQIGSATIEICGFCSTIESFFF
jgi:hypothetical protein